MGDPTLGKIPIHSLRNPGSDGKLLTESIHSPGIGPINRKSTQTQVGSRKIMSTTLPPPTDPRWGKLITGTLQPDFLGAKILVGRLTATYRRSPDPATMTACCTELHGLYAKVSHLPKIQSEITILFK